MSGESWTDRYSPQRFPPVPLRLQPPLQRAWKYAADGAGLGFVCTGDGAVFTTVGTGAPLRLDLSSGKIVWTGAVPVCLLAAWRSELLGFDDDSNALLLDRRSGEIRARRPCRAGLGVQGSYIVLDVLVGALAGKFHAVDLPTLEPLWEVEGLVGNPLVGDDERVIRAWNDVSCFDLRTGSVQWQRRGSDFGGDAYRPGCIWEGRFFCILGGQLTALDLETGRTLWRWKLPSAIHWWQPYDGLAYCFFDGVYRVVDLRKGEQVFERSLGPRVPEPVRGKKSGLTVGTRGAEPAGWRDVRVAVSDTNVFLTNGSGQIVVLKRDTGEVEQVVEIDAMPADFAGPVIYENRLLLTGFDAAVYCFEGAAG